MNFKLWKMLFYTILMLSISIVISSYSWFTMWMSLEINMLSIIPLMNNSKNMFMTESSLKYFIVQSMASSLLLLSIIMLMINESDKSLIIMNSSLLIKMGSAPFHYWFPEIMEGQLWMMAFNLMTIQKISPLMLLNYNLNMPYLLLIIVIMNMMVSALMGMNQISIRKLMTYSSINHIGWMITAFLFMKTIWILYFFVYTFLLMNITFMLNTFNIFYMKQMIKSNMPLLFKMTFMFNLFSMGGLPPFIGFIPKWLTIQMMINNNMELLMILMVMLTLFTLYYYIRFTMSSMLLMKTNYFKNMNIMVLYNSLNLIILPLIFLIFMI